MKNYQPPSDDPFADILDSGAPKPVPNDDLVRIYHDWKELHRHTRSNLMAFEHPEFELSSSAVGIEQVANLVSSILFPYASGLHHYCITHI
jgi:hypothetical protein